jgi:hypothetical protein
MTNQAIEQTVCQVISRPASLIAKTALVIEMTGKWKGKVVSGMI